jgi:hypothetical protein
MIVGLRERDSRYPDLTPGQPYVVLGIETDDLRILNDQGRPYLYSHEIFTVPEIRDRSCRPASDRGLFNIQNYYRPK